MLIDSVPLLVYGYNPTGASLELSALGEQAVRFNFSRLCLGNSAQIQSVRNILTQVAPHGWGTLAPVEMMVVFNKIYPGIVLVTQ